MNSLKIAQIVLWNLFCCFALAGCAEIGELQKPVASAYYGKIALPPNSGEFRWANGELPKTFDPVLAQSPSEMQAVRALFDGLTDWDSQTLKAVPALAARWTPSEDFRTWTFYLRSGAVWSNGKRVTAQDFVRSWRRFKELGANSLPHQQLLSNIVGAKSAQNTTAEPDKVEVNESKVANQKLKPTEIIRNPQSEITNETWFGAEAVDNLTLRVYLVLPDKDFPKLVAHSALRPIWNQTDFDKPEAAVKIVTNGAFRISSYDRDGISFERSKNYWDSEKVKIERIRFVSIKDADNALAAYQAGEVDAVTNAHLEPLTFKLLASYRDFKRTAFNAVTFYEFNETRAPFDDHRVREALSIALDRERLTNDELDGAMFPAYSFLPDSTNDFFKFDIQRAQKLLTEAGFTNGKNFPKIKLLINRNESAQKIAKAIAAQWQKHLGLETEITTSSLEELDNSVATKDFDLVRRVIVLPTTNETANLQAMFKGINTTGDQTVGDDLASNSNNLLNTAPPASVEAAPVSEKSIPPSASPESSDKVLPAGKQSKTDGDKSNINPNKLSESSQSNNQLNNQFAAKGLLNSNEIVLSRQVLTPILSEANAFDEIPAIPLYFPSSYALVKPYIKGFEINLLEAPSLKNVGIQSDWEPPKN